MLNKTITVGELIDKYSNGNLYENYMEQIYNELSDCSLYIDSDCKKNEPLNCYIDKNGILVITDKKILNNI